MLCVEDIFNLKCLLMESKSKSGFFEYKVTFGICVVNSQRFCSHRRLMEYVYIKAFWYKIFKSRFTIGDKKLMYITNFILKEPVILCLKRNCRNITQPFYSIENLCCEDQQHNRLFLRNPTGCNIKDL